MTDYAIGWDIGGAHVKAAALDSQGRVACALQHPCPLWKGLEYLRLAVNASLRELPAGGCRHYLTMTGELADCFANRAAGVAAITQAMRELLSDAPLRVFSRHGFITPEQALAADPLDVASLNWLASAALAARNLADGVFIDIGSTTTDLAAIQNGQLNIQGYTDYQRLISGELVYTGIVRTPVMAVAQYARFNGQEMGLMAEFFASMADVYRVTGELNEAHDQTASADGAEKTAAASARRLSRMTGYDFEPSDWPRWQAFAQELKQKQKALLRRALQRRLPESATRELTLCGAGVGRFLVRELAAEFGFDYQDFARLLLASGPHYAGMDAGDCAPAVAVAYLGFAG